MRRLIIPVCPLVDHLCWLILSARCGPPRYDPSRLGKPVCLQVHQVMTARWSCRFTSTTLHKGFLWATTIFSSSWTCRLLRRRWAILWCLDLIRHKSFKECATSDLEWRAGEMRITIWFYVFYLANSHQFGCGNWESGGREHSFHCWSTWEIVPPPPFRELGLGIRLAVFTLIVLASKF